jgi:transcriptional regulator with XRE-family HTH domain
MREEWEAESDEMTEDQPRIGRYPASGLIRRARRVADLSQREMATRAGVSPSTVGRVEAGVIAPSLDVMQRLLATAGMHLVVIDHEGRVVLPMLESEDTRDGAERRYPSHLDTILDPRMGEWWADQFGLARPPETFKRDRQRRDEMRARSRWEVRVSLLRSAPEPPIPGAREAWLARRRKLTEDWERGIIALSPLGVDDFDPDD